MCRDVGQDDFEPDDSESTPLVIRAWRNANGIRVRLNIADSGTAGPVILTSSSLDDVFDAVRAWIDDELSPPA